MSRGFRFSPYDLRGFKLVDGKIVTTLPKDHELGPEPEPFHPPVDDDPPPRDDEPEAA